jgi:hypothetical protein
MSIRIIGASLFVLALFSGTGCNNTNCEQGAYCVDDEPPLKRPGGRECLMLCGQLALCAAPQADDFNACVADCDARFESEPEETAMLCACAEWSSCEDITRNRCSDRPHGSGGSGSGGASGASGSGASGGTAGAVGSAGTGAAGTGGTGAAGSGGTGAAGTGGTGAAGSGGTGAAGTGGTGPITCGRDCDCPLPDVCVGGYCVAP